MQFPICLDLKCVEIEARPTKGWKRAFFEELIVGLVMLGNKHALRPGKTNYACSRMAIFATQLRHSLLLSAWQPRWASEYYSGR